MNVDYDESYPIKSEVIVIVTFSKYGQYEDFGNQELKMEPLHCKESFKCEIEVNPVEHTDTHVAPINQYICNKCNFITTEEDSLIEHLKITKNVEYFCEVCNFKTLFECSVKEHSMIHNKTLRISPLLSQLDILKTGDKYIYKECDYETSRRQKLKTHVQIRTDKEYKCNECNYKTGKVI
ncbi:hypothetical protein FQA39_LY05683 [Lamprigera yunnana]|nr:hypothetical protein FQA39_LY05683 [Lamprigera yunnana]